VVAEKCVQIVKARRRRDGEPAVTPPKKGETPEEAWCSSIIGDFSGGESSEAGKQTVFGRHVPTHWKAVLLVDAANVRLFPYLIVHRDAKGNWILSVRAHAGEDVRKSYKAFLKVTSVSARMNEKVSPEDHEGWGFCGSPLAPDASESAVTDSGSFLLLSDAQVKRLKEGASLFRYWVRLVPKE